MEFKVKLSPTPNNFNIIFKKPQINSILIHHSHIFEDSKNFPSFTLVTKHSKLCLHISKVRYRSNKISLVKISRKMKLLKIFLRYFPPGIALKFTKNQVEETKYIDLFDLTSK